MEEGSGEAYAHEREEEGRRGGGTSIHREDEVTTGGGSSAGYRKGGWRWRAVWRKA